MGEASVRWQIKGIRREKLFHVDGFRGREDAIDTALAVAGASEWDRVIVVDMTEWEAAKRIEGGAVGIVWDSEEEEG